MALGFHKSLFGYNCEEVTEYVHKTITSNQEIQNSLNNKIKDANLEIDKLKSLISDMNTEKAQIEEQLAYYQAKYEEIKILSENIGKLYLVAQTNANAIINAAEKSKDATYTEIGNNLAVIDSTNESLNEMKTRINELTAEFCSRVDELNGSLLKTKLLIENATADSAASKEEYDTVFNSLTK
ncbi:MAG: hypothetical protein IJN93_07275 [Clostridia bacterium]|nr:hypothetical protein [Clostridia bacterium]